MATGTKTKPKTKAEPEGPEDRIDEQGIRGFERMGMTGRLSDSLIETYKEFKLVKDRLDPGPLSGEGYAFVILVAKLREELG